MTDHWAHIRTYLLGQVLFSCTGIAGLMAFHIADGDRFGFLVAAMAAGCGYAGAMVGAHSSSSSNAILSFAGSWLAICGVACAVGSAALILI